MKKIEKGADATRPPKVDSLISNSPRSAAALSAFSASSFMGFLRFVGPLTQLRGAQQELKVIKVGNRVQVGTDVEQGLGSMASLQAVSEEEWHEEVANLSPKELVEATFQRLFPGSFLYALPIWKHKVAPLHVHALHPACFKQSG